MKKILVLLLTTLTVVVLVGCNAKNDKSEEKEELSKVEQQIETTYIFGKVEKIVGNEVSLKLSTDEFIGIEENEEKSNSGSFAVSESEMQQLENGQTVTLADGTVIQGIAMDSSDEAIEGDVGSKDMVEEFIGDEELNGVNPFSQLEFNGESKDLIISAGVEIFNMTNGKEGKISDIKEGSILNITVDSKTNAVTRVDIVG
ncbi:Uncharacterised protein [uncultured Clostridium sp.]|uniref:hypothetical protein n=1 Tax=uncultured Clostridium sp. TaxID=59620 RepID=UPI000821A57C|nr:hypothetical protein [uncultured Clostridium sp.]SCK04422.1 Uncharacterised protein [uncultured Clostridium sp.]